MDLSVVLPGSKSKDNLSGTSVMDELNSKMENGSNFREKKHQDEFEEYTYAKTLIPTYGNAKVSIR